MNVCLVCCGLYLVCVLIVVIMEGYLSLVGALCIQLYNVVDIDVISGMMCSEVLIMSEIS